MSSTMRCYSASRLCPTCKVRGSSSSCARLRAATTCSRPPRRYLPNSIQRLGPCCCLKLGRAVALPLPRCRFRCVLLRRLRLPLLLEPRACCCGGALGPLGDQAACPTTGVLVRRAGPPECAVARVCREAGARVATNIFLRDLNRCATARGCRERACRFRRRTGSCRRDACEPSAARWDQPTPRRRRARRSPAGGNRPQTPEHLPGVPGAARCRLVVVALEVGGRWGDETEAFLHRLAPRQPQSPARKSCRRIRAPVGAVAGCAQGALAASLSSLPPDAGDAAAGAPPQGDVMRDARWAPDARALVFHQRTATRITITTTRFYRTRDEGNTKGNTKNNSDEKTTSVRFLIKEDTDVLNRAPCLLEQTFRRNLALFRLRGSAGCACRMCSGTGTCCSCGRRGGSRKAASVAALAGASGAAVRAALAAESSPKCANASSAGRFIGSGFRMAWSWWRARLALLRPPHRVVVGTDPPRQAGLGTQAPLA